MMNFIQSIFKRSQPVAIEKTSRTFAVDVIENPWGMASPYDLNAAKAAMAESPWVFRCVSVIASAIKSVPYYIKRGTGEDAEDIEDDGMYRQFLSNPNPHNSYDDMIDLITASLELTGDAYLEWVRDKGNLEAYVLPSERVNPIPSARDLIQGYNYLGANGRQVKFAAHELIRVCYPNPNDQLHGLSPLKAAERELTAEFYAGTYNTKFFKNGATVSGYIKSDVAMADDEVERFKVKWHNQFSGAENAHKVVILSGGMEFVPIGTNPKDMEFLLLRKWSREAILAAFGVPPVMVGVFEYANYANSVEQKKIFWQNTIIPKMKKLEYAISKLLKTLFFDDVSFCFDISEVDALKDDEEKQTRMAIEKVNAGLIDRDEGRIEAGYSPTEDPNMKIRTVSTAAIPLAEQLAPVEAVQDTDVDGNPKGAGTSDPYLDASRLLLAIQRLEESGDSKGADALRDQLFNLLGMKIPKGGIDDGKKPAKAEPEAMEAEDTALASSKKGKGYEALFSDN